MEAMAEKGSFSNPFAEPPKRYGDYSYVSDTLYEENSFSFIYRIVHFNIFFIVSHRDNVYQKNDETLINR